MAEPLISPDSKIPFLQVREFADAKADGVAHGFFGRAGGSSKGIYAGLNCGIGSSDIAADVKANRAGVADVLGVNPENILSLYQVHGDTCLKVTQPHNSPPEADAQVTDVPGLAISILTAD